MWNTRDLGRMSGGSAARAPGTLLLAALPDGSPSPHWGSALPLTDTQADTPGPAPPPDPRTWRAVRPGQEQKGRWAERSVPQELLPSEPEALETEQNDVFCLLILLVWKVLSVLLRRVV